MLSPVERAMFYAILVGIVSMLIFATHSVVLLAFSWSRRYFTTLSIHKSMQVKESLVRRLVISDEGFNILSENLIITSNDSLSSSFWT